MKFEPQNVYDHPEFFAVYSGLRHDDTGLKGMLAAALRP